MKTYGISFGYVGILHNNVYKTWNILDRKFKINYIKNHSSHPHITLIAGKTANIEKIMSTIIVIHYKRHDTPPTVCVSTTITITSTHIHISATTTILADHRPLRFTLHVGEIRIPHM